MAGLNKTQLERRRAGVGASEIAVLAGLSKWSSPALIWESKVLGRGIDPTYAMDLGTEIEAPIARVWAKREGKFLALVDTITHPTHPLALATPDRAIYSTQAMRGDARKKRTDVRDADGGLLQVKSTNWRMRGAWGPEGTDQIPDDYLCQAHWEGAVAGAAMVTFAVDFDKTALHQWVVKVNQDVFLALYELAERFMVDHVQARVPPPPDGTEAFSEFLGRYFPRDTKADLVKIAPGSDPLIEGAIAEFLFLKAADKRLKARKERAYQMIAQAIGDAAGVEGAFGKVTWKRTKDGTKLDVKVALAQTQGLVRSLAANHPDGAAMLANLAEIERGNTVTVPGHRTMRTSPAPHLKWNDSITLELEAPAVGVLGPGGDAEADQ